MKGFVPGEKLSLNKYYDIEDNQFAVIVCQN